MDKLLNFVAAVEDAFGCYRVSVSPVADEDYDYIVSCRKLYKKDSGANHAFEVHELSNFRREFERMSVRTGVNEDVPDVGKGFKAETGFDDGLAQHWIEFRVKQ